tara:strand:- start:336 stop:479 length:144 start_codon:yes stop_codon:yes gene_type:complete
MLLAPVAAEENPGMAEEKAEIVKWGVRVMDDIFQELNQRRIEMLELS